MDRRDQELLDKQLGRIAPTPRRDGVIVLVMLAVFVAGLTFGDLLARPAKPPAQVAANDTIVATTFGTGATHRATP